MEDHRTRLFKLYGTHSLSYSTFQKGLSYFQTNDGYIAYTTFEQRLLGYRLSAIAVLGDPVVKPSSKYQLIRSFLRCHPKALFFVISTHTAQCLQKLGYYYHYIGHENTVNLSSLKLNWNSHKSLKYCLSQGNKEPLHIKELTIDTLPQEQLDDIHHAWLKQKRNTYPYQWFLTRPLTNKDLSSVRCFGAYKEGTLVGFRFFDPLYKEGVLQGYHPSITRWVTDAPSCTSTYILLKAMAIFKQEQLSILKLGLSPFSKSKAKTLREQCWFTLIKHCCDCFYGIKGIHTHKHKFRPIQPPQFIAYSSAYPLLSLAICYCGMCHPLWPLQQSTERPLKQLRLLYSAIFNSCFLEKTRLFLRRLFPLLSKISNQQQYKQNIKIS